MGHVFSRDPALSISLIATSARLATAFLVEANSHQQSLINAVIAAVAGLCIAFIVHDGQSAGLLGVAQALIALAVGYGLKIDAEQQAVIMSLVGTATAMFIRTQVVAPTGPN